jgi:hypothetical protein
MVISDFMYTWPEYWSVLCLPTPVFMKPFVRLGNQLQPKCDLEQNTLWNPTLGSKANLWKCVETAQHSREYQTRPLCRFCPKAERRHSNTQATFYWTLMDHGFPRITKLNFNLHTHCLWPRIYCTCIQRKFTRPDLISVSYKSHGWRQGGLSQASPPPSSLVWGGKSKFKE